MKYRINFIVKCKNYMLKDATSTFDIDGAARSTRLICYKI